MAIAVALLIGLIVGVGAGIRIGQRGPGSSPIASTQPIAAGKDGGLVARFAPAPVDGGALTANDSRDGGAPAQAIDVHVEVLTATGQPAAGVLVTALLIDTSGLPLAAPRALQPAGELGILSGPLPRLDAVLRGGVGGQPAVAGISAVSDARGQARLRVTPPPGEQKPRLQLLASHDNLSASAELLLPAARERGAASVVLRLNPAPVAAALLTDDAEAVPLGQRVALRGQVRDERNRPLAGATIEVTPPGSIPAPSVGAAARPGLIAQSDPRGEFSFPAVPQARLALRARAPGYAPLSRILGPDEPPLRDGAPLELAMTPGGGVEGEVRDRRGGAVPRAQLVWQHGTERLPIPLGADGRFRLTGLPPGDGALVLSAPGYATLRQPLTLAAAEHLDQVTARDLRLSPQRAGVLSGRLRGPRELGGIAVQVLSEGDEVLARAQSNARGEFRVSGLPEGLVRVRARGAAGQAEASTEIRAESEARVDLDLAP